MRYYKVKTDYSPLITGKRNGGNAVEIKEKVSFYSDSDKKLWKEFYSQDIINGTERCLWGSYAIFNNMSLESPICFYPTSKRIRQLDFMAFAPHMRTLQFLVSEKVYNIIKNFRLPIYNAIPANIDTFEQQYYLLGFPTIDFGYYDFTKSKFNNYITGKMGAIESEDTYTKLFISGRVETIIIKLNTKFDIDIINVPGATFFSSSIIEFFEREKITGYIRGNEILEN